MIEKQHPPFSEGVFYVFQHRMYGGGSYVPEITHAGMVYHLFRPWCFGWIPTGKLAALLGWRSILASSGAYADATKITGLF